MEKGVAPQDIRGADEIDGCDPPITGVVVALENIGCSTTVTESAGETGDEVSSLANDIGNGLELDTAYTRPGLEEGDRDLDRDCPGIGIRDTPRLLCGCCCCCCCCCR